MVAHSGSLVRIFHDRGRLVVQLIEYEPRNSVHHPRVFANAQLSRAVWDPWVSPPSLVLCAVAGGVLPGERSPSYLCGRREVATLREDMGIEMISALAFTVMVLLCCCFTCARLWVQANGRVFRLFRGRGSGMTVRRRDLRQQLAALPSAQTAPPRQLSEISMQEAVGQCSEDSNRLQEAARDSAPPEADKCPTCHQEIAVRVVLDRCGHTTCRDCALRLLDSDRKCYVCGAVAKGMLPVYV